MNYQLIDGIVIVILSISCYIQINKNISLRKRIKELERINNIKVNQPEILK